MKKYKIFYRAGSNSSYIIVSAQTRADAKSKAKYMLVPGAQIICVEQQ